MYRFAPPRMLATHERPLSDETRASLEYLMRSLGGDAVGILPADCRIELVAPLPCRTFAARTSLGCIGRPS